MTAQYPPIADILLTVRDFIDGIRPGLKSEQRYHAQVASYLLDIVSREIRAATQSEADPFHLDEPERFRAALAHGDFDCCEQDLIRALLDHSASNAAIVRPQHVDASSAQEPKP